jgi:hypothetical protein
LFLLSSSCLGSNCGRKTSSQIEGFKLNEYKDKIKKKHLSPNKEYFVKLFKDDAFQNVLKNTATTDEGMDVVAQY